MRFKPLGPHPTAFCIVGPKYYISTRNNTESQSQKSKANLSAYRHENPWRATEDKSEGQQIRQRAQNGRSNIYESRNFTHRMGTPEKQSRGFCTMLKAHLLGIFASVVLDENETDSCFRSPHVRDLDRGHRAILGTFLGHVFHHLGEKHEQDADR